MRFLHSVYKINVYWGNCAHFRNYGTDVTSWVYSQRHIWQFRYESVYCNPNWTNFKMQFYGPSNKWQVAHPNLHTTQRTAYVCMRSTAFPANLYFSWPTTFEKVQKRLWHTLCRTGCLISFYSIFSNRVESIRRTQERKGHDRKLCSHPLATTSPLQLRLDFP